MAGWVVKVEYKCDKSQTNVSPDFIRDLDCGLLPAFDVHRQYRAFWSPLEEDSPALMLKRVPEVPDLTKEEENKGKPGYYRACILAVTDDKSKFELSRTRKSTLRGQKVIINKGKKGNAAQNVEKKSVTDSNKNRAGRTNVSLYPDTDHFSEVDADNDFCSDDSEEDATLVPDQQVKVLKSSVKVLKDKLLEKCQEITALNVKLQDKDNELKTLRELNTQLQQKILDKVPLFIDQCVSSRSSSRSSSCSEFNTKSLSDSSRSRSISCSSMSSEAPDGHCSGTFRTPNPKTPLMKSGTIPVTPKVSTPRTNTAPSFKPTSLLFSPPLGSAVVSKSKNPLDDSDVQSSAASVASLSPSGSILDNTLTHSPLHFEQSEGDQVVDQLEGDKCIEQSDNSINTKEGISEPTPKMVDFIPGWPVIEAGLKKCEDNPLRASSDGTYIREIAVLVFGIETLYKSSLSQRKSKVFGPGRPALNEAVLTEIKNRLQKRVYLEHQNQVPPADLERFKQTKVNRKIYEKIKQLRTNVNLQKLYGVLQD